MQEPLDALVLDIANMDSSSTDYPLARHKDMFDFHSWASGLFPQGNGKSQESISEVNNKVTAT
jgi:endo-1,3(4)-beta-glucanase